MDFNEKQYDGPYEISAVEIIIKEQLLRGLLYFPEDLYPKPYPIIVYFHDFPNLYSLHQIAVNLEFLLKTGFSLFLFNFRGYNYSQGIVSLQSQVQDSLKIAEFIQLMGKKGIFKPQEINILAHGFGSYIALLLCSKIDSINNILLLSPILDVKKQLNNENFVKTLQYLNKYLPGNVHGIENIEDFLLKTESELNCNDYRVEKLLNEMKFNKMKLIIGSKNKIIDISELKANIFDQLANVEVVLIEQMDHDWIEEENMNKIQEEIQSFFD